ncbi:unnamed protein product, partial [Mesorhabditis spiculigera]
MLGIFSRILQNRPSSWIVSAASASGRWWPQPERHYSANSSKSPTSSDDSSATDDAKSTMVATTTHRGGQLALDNESVAPVYYERCGKGEEDAFASEASDGSLLALPYKDVDFRISDIDENALEQIGITSRPAHLSTGVFPATPFPVLGRVHGKNSRLMVPLVCQHVDSKKTPILHVWFLVGTGVPYTCLTVKSLEKLVGLGFTNHTHNIAIQDPKTYVQCQISRAGFADVNVLGMDAIQELELSIRFDWQVSKKIFHLVKL